MTQNECASHAIWVSREVNAVGGLRVVAALNDGNAAQRIARADRLRDVCEGELIRGGSRRNPSENASMTYIETFGECKAAPDLVSLRRCIVWIRDQMHSLKTLRHA